jgi:3-dehydrotetronate 4-kinase
VKQVARGIVLGAIADDFTGATDLANNLVRAGLRVVQTIGVPGAPLEHADAADGADEVDAIVVALKSRTAPVAEAVAQSRAAAQRLRAAGARQIYFKVCSTFDSTPAGNIGPVAEALATDLGAAIVPVTPAFPENGRTVFMGHLFVGEQLLSDSPMREHPLTPMTDANLLRVLQAQLRRGRTGLVARRTVAQGAAAIGERLAALQQAGVTMAIVDAVDNDDLHRLAEAVHTLPLVVAGSGLAIGLPKAWGFAPAPQAALLPAARGAAAVISGSCSAATQAQVAHFVAAGGAALAIDPLRAAAGPGLLAEALAWATPRLGRQPVLVYATAAADAVRAVQAQLGVARAGQVVEQLLGQVAAGLVERGVARQIDPGVPWCHAPEQRLHLSLKSGNFGGVDFFSRAFTVLA